MRDYTAQSAEHKLHQPVPDHLAVAVAWLVGRCGGGLRLNAERRIVGIIASPDALAAILAEVEQRAEAS